MVKYRQGIAIIDTADPILFRFLRRGDTEHIAMPAQRSIESPQTLAEAVESMTRLKAAEALATEEKRLVAEQQDAAPISPPDRNASSNGHRDTPVQNLDKRSASTQTPVTIDDFDE